MEYLYGLATGIVLFALLYTAYHLGTQKNKPIQTKAQPPTEDEQRKAERLQKGFDEIMSYNLEKARGSKLE